MIQYDSSTISSRARLRHQTSPSSLTTPVPTDRSVLPRPPEELRRTLRVKAMLDWLFAVLLSIPALPVIGLCVLLVRLSSRGPGIYRQQRVGQFGRVFTIYKIRTMYHECESFTGPRWAAPRDPRVTGIGKVLRALHLDELPQLLNVLRGEMSLIGPRPERPEIAAKLARSIEKYDSRVVVKPGVSGFAQVHLPPDTNLGSVRDKLVLDTHYLRHFSSWFDTKILFWTGLKMFGLFRKRGLDAIPNRHRQAMNPR